MPCEPLQIHSGSGSEQHINDVFATFAFPIVTADHIEHIVASLQQPFSDEKSGHELSIATRRPHDDRDTSAADADFERLFDRQHIVR